MADKTNIREIVTEIVSVEEPKIVELHKPLAGNKTAQPGSPAGSEAKPKLHRSGGPKTGTLD